MSSRPLHFLVAPDFPPAHIAGWHMLNTALQRRTGLHVRLLLPGDFREQRDMLESRVVDIAYANPFDASRLMREAGYSVFARPAGHSDEIVIAAAARTQTHAIAALRPGCRIAVTPSSDIRRIGLRFLEAADLDETNVQWVPVESYQGVARLLINNLADVGFFLSHAFHAFTGKTRSQMRVLVESRLRDIFHLLLLNPAHRAQLPLLQSVLLDIGTLAKDQEILAALGLSAGFERQEQDDAEFMLDLMEAWLFYDANEEAQEPEGAVLFPQRG